MAAIPKMAPISEFRARQNELLQQLAEGPLVLTQHGRAAAVLVSLEQWNHLIEKLEYLEDSLIAIEASQDPAPTIPFDQYLAKRGECVPDKVEA